MPWKIPLFKIYWDEQDVKSIARVIRSGMHWAEGSDIKKFEQKLGDYLGQKYCLVFSSGTSALHALLLAYGIKKGDEVIVPSFTFISTANAALFVGAKPVFADIEEETLGLDPEDVAKKINAKTRAIIAVHYGGSPCKIRELKKIAKDNNLLLFEDVAESFGALIKDRYTGTFGEAAMFSFCQNKIITTGEGGALVVNSRKIYEKLKLIRSHGRDERNNYFSSHDASDYIDLGYNFRMPTYVASLGIAQLKKAGKIIKMRKDNARYLTAKLKQNARKIITPDAPAGYSHVYQLYTIRIKEGRDELKQFLADKGIMTKVYFSPAHLSLFYRKKLNYKDKLPVTEKLAQEVLTLPMYPALSRKDMEYMVEAIKSF